MTTEKIDTQSILKKVAEIISEQLGISEGDIHLKSHFINDLGADSLDIVELMMAFEEAFKDFSLTIPDDEAEKLSTVGDTVSYIETKIAIG